MYIYLNPSNPFHWYFQGYYWKWTKPKWNNMLKKVSLALPDKLSRIVFLTFPSVLEASHVYSPLSSLEIEWILRIPPTTSYRSVDTTDSPPAKDRPFQMMNWNVVFWEELHCYCINNNNSKSNKHKNNVWRNRPSKIPVWTNLFEFLRMVEDFR